MAEVVGIMRRPTEDEARDFINIGPGKRLPFDRLLREKIGVFEQKYAKLHKPFCRNCAKMDIRDEKERLEKELMRRSANVKNTEELQDAIATKLNMDDLDEYAKEDRFEFLREYECKEKTLIGTTSVLRQIGYDWDYKCKIRGCRVAVFIPLNVWEERKGVKVNFKDIQTTDLEEVQRKDEVEKKLFKKKKK